MKISPLGITTYSLLKNQQKENISFGKKEKNNNKGLTDKQCFMHMGLIATIPYLVIIPSIKYLATPDNCREINKIVRYIPSEINTTTKNIKINNKEVSNNSIKLNANIAGEDINIKVDMRKTSETETEGTVSIYDNKSNDKKDGNILKTVDVKIKNVAPDVFECDVDNKKMILENNKGKITLKDEKGKIKEKFKLDIPYILPGIGLGTLFWAGVCLLICIYENQKSITNDYTDNDGYFD